MGELYRITWIVTNWFRSCAYYASGGWRATWAGEGGGVLMNQAPHTLDLLCHLAGMPQRVWGWTRTLAHAIETEDTAQAMLEFANGAPGYLYTTTVEAGAPQYLQIVGDRAALELHGAQLTISRFEPPLSTFRSTSPELFAQPHMHIERPVLPSGGGDHLAVYQDLEQALRTGRRPRADGRAGRMSLELANAIILSSHSGSAVTLPLDRAAYAALLAELKEQHRL